MCQAELAGCIQRGNDCLMRCLRIGSNGDRHPLSRPHGLADSGLERLQAGIDDLLFTNEIAPLGVDNNFQGFLFLLGWLGRRLRKFYLDA